jgi:hypothetical protein
MIPQIKPTRRDALRLFAAGSAFIVTGGMAFPAVAEDASLERTFLAAFDAPRDKPDQGAAIRLAFLHESAIVIDHGAPFPMGKAGYADHLGFHLANLQRLETHFHELKTVRHGGTMIISAFFNERSKPKDSGFRLRAGFCTAVCTLTSGGWKALSLHMSPLTSQVIDASPG